MLYNVSFSGGQASDYAKRLFPPDKFLDAENIDILPSGEFYEAQNIKGTTFVTNLYDLGEGNTYNVLCSVPVQGRYDLDGDGEYEEVNNSLLVCLHVDRPLALPSRSVILLYNFVNDTTYTLYDLPEGDAGYLNFPPTGTIDGFFQMERGVPLFRFADDANPLRVVRLEYSTSPFVEAQRFRALWLRPPLAGNFPVLSSVEEGGSLPSGSYAIAFRYWSFRYCRGSAWSAPCHPIPVTPSDPCNPKVGGHARGGKVLEVTTRKIVVSVPVSPDTGFEEIWDGIQIAIIPYNDGSEIDPLIAILKPPRKEDYTNNTGIEITSLDGVEVSVGEVVVEDSPLIRAKSIITKDGYAFAGNVAYNDFDYDRGAPEVSKARTIKYAMPNDKAYTCEEDTFSKKGHFRDEQYAFGVAHFDEFGNYGPVQPLDLSGQYALNRDEEWVAETIILSVVNTAVAYSVVTVGGVSYADLLEKGDWVVIDGLEGIFYVINAYDVLGGTAMELSQLEDNLLPGVFQVTFSAVGQSLYKVVGASGNNSNNWAWKFAGRGRGYPLLDESSNVQAIGLQLTGLTNHPSWARGGVIVRQPRKKNILGQALHVPGMAAMACVTNGVDPKGTRRDIDNDQGDTVNTYLPKNFLLGAVRDVRPQLNFEDDDANDMLVQPAKYTLSDGHALLWVQHPDYMFNYKGEPAATLDTELIKGIDIVDAVMFKRDNIVWRTKEFGGGNPAPTTKFAGGGLFGGGPSAITPIPLPEEAIDRYYATSWYEYYHRVHTYFSIGVGGLLSYYAKSLLSVISFVSAELTDPYDDVNNVTVDAIQTFALGHPRYQFSAPPDPNGVYRDVRFWGGGLELSRQQQSNPSVAVNQGFSGLFENQRGILVKTSARIPDFTSIYVQGLFDPSFVNYLPDMPSGEQPATNRAINLNTHLNDQYIDKPVEFETWPADQDLYYDEHHTGGFILNLVRGLGDDRYGRKEDIARWQSTGTTFTLTPQQVEDNEPLNLEVWGGDCFVTKYRQKVNSGMIMPQPHRQFNVAEGLDPATPIGEYIDDLYGMTSNWGIKSGCFDKHIQVLEYFVESEINTAYRAQEGIYPDEDTYPAKESSFDKSWLYPYNRGYSAQPTHKSFRQRLENCDDNNGEYPARRHISDKKIYQAEDIGLTNVEGFDRWRVLSTSDADESMGSITKLIDNGGGYIYTLQERGVRYDPVNRDVVQLGEANQLLTGFSPIGGGGAYMLDDSGCQHIRSVKQGRGVAHFYDAINRRVMAIGAGEAMWCISLQINESGEGIKYFMSKWFEDREVPVGEEYLVDGYFSPDKGEYGLRYRGGIAKWQRRFSRVLDNWVGGLSWEGSTVYDIYYAHDALYAIDLAPSVSQQTRPLRLWRMYSEDTPNATKLFGIQQNAFIEVVLNQEQGKNKVFGEIILDSIQPWDTGAMLVPRSDEVGSLIDSAITFTQSQKNGWYRANILRDDNRRAKMRGKFGILRLTLNSLASNNRIARLQAILYRARESFKNY